MNLASEFMALEPNIRSGTLRMFGCWFGRPMDNIHQSESAVFDGQVLRVRFSKGEMLEVWNPSGIVVEGCVLKILHASSVKWSWRSESEPRQPENSLYYEYIVEGDHVTSYTNLPWSNQPSIHEPAVELC